MTSARPRPPVSQGKASYAISTHRREGDRDAPRAYPPLCKYGLCWRTSMIAHRDKFFAYFQVPRDGLGNSGLGLDADREAVINSLNGGSWNLAAESVEMESGKHNDRPHLLAALAACKKPRARLVIAKFDRLSRNLAFI